MGGCSGRSKFEDVDPFGKGVYKHKTKKVKKFSKSEMNMFKSCCTIGPVVHFFAGWTIHMLLTFIAAHNKVYDILIQA